MNSTIVQTYRESLDYLFSQLPMFSRIGAAAYKPGLETSITLDNFFGNPHRKFKSIHIGGTNGKGSTSHNIASILQSANYKVGLYTSPHLADFRERIRINGEMIPHERVVDFISRWKRTPYNGHPSFFELTMMMAFDWFANEEVDYAVIEVGMGGRLDSTNIITPIGCVITNISPDHTQFLGETLPEIASEKAGIIKENVPVVIGHAEGEVREVFEKRARELGSPIDFAEENILVKFGEPQLSGIRGFSTMAGEFLSPLGGEYQKENLNTILHAVEMLRRQGVEISGDAIRRGLENVVKQTGLAGRWMIIEENPFTVCDTGHNIAGLTQTLSQLESTRKLISERGRDERKQKVNSRLIFVIGFVNDKDVEHISDLLPKDGIYYVTQASVPRAMPASDLFKILQKRGLDCILVPEGVATAYKAARTESGPDDIIYIGGSTFIVADFITSIRRDGGRGE